MPIFTKELELPKGLNREQTKRYVIECFLDEEPGKGTKKLASKYFTKLDI